MIDWIKKKIHQNFICDHPNIKKRVAPTILRNGKLATLVIKECKDCLLVSSHTEAFEYGKIYRRNKGTSASQRNDN